MVEAGERIDDVIGYAWIGGAYDARWLIKFEVVVRLRLLPGHQKPVKVHLITGLESIIWAAHSHTIDEQASFADQSVGRASAVRCPQRAIHSETIGGERMRTEREGQQQAKTLHFLLLSLKKVVTQDYLLSYDDGDDFSHQWTL